MTFDPNTPTAKPPMTVPGAIPSTPDVAAAVQLASLIRLVIALLAGAGIGTGVLAGMTPDQISTLAEIILIGGSLFLAGIAYVWSYFKNISQALQTHNVAVASANASAQATVQAGVPVAVPIQPTVPPVTVLPH